MPVPVITCGSDQSLDYANLPHTVSLTAAATESPTAWEWEMVSVPPGSSADSGTNGDFTNGVASVQNPSFDTDVGGDYVIQARAQNVTGWSLPSEDKESAQTIVSVDTVNGNRIPGALTWNASWGVKLQSLLHTIEDLLYKLGLTTKGDIIVRDANGVTRLPVSGNDGYVLSEDSNETTGLKWVVQSGGGGGGGFDREQVFTAAPTGGLETFTISASAATNGNHPSGYSCRVYVNGLKYKPVATGVTPSGREYRLTSATAVQVAGLSTNDQVEIVYGV